MAFDWWLADWLGLSERAPIRLFWSGLDILGFHVSSRHESPYCQLSGAHSSPKHYSHFLSNSLIAVLSPKGLITDELRELNK